jgi:hypothetical protein
LRLALPRYCHPITIACSNGNHTSATPLKLLGRKVELHARETA